MLLSWGKVAALASLLGWVACGGGGGQPPPPRPTLTFLGGTQAAIVGGSALPARNGLAKPTDTIEITTRTAPEGSAATPPAHSVTLIFSTDDFATQSSRPMAFVSNDVGPNQDQALWRATLGPFPVGTEVVYFIRASTDGTALTDNNGGANFEFNIPWVGSIPLTPPFVVLQWFATPWRDLQRRLPEVVNAGYNTLYLPPPQKAATGMSSVGFDPFDRFDLGDRLQRGAVRTNYGTTQELLELVDAAHQLGLRVCFDLVVNHNANRATGVLPSGYPNLIPEDFHFQGATGQEIIDFSSFGFQTLNWELLGLVDIAQEDGNKVTPPSDPPNPLIGLNAQQKPSWVRQPRLPQYYPQGTPVPEDVRQYLVRWGRWLGEVVGADCFRLDAVRHVPPPFFGGPDTFRGAANESYTVTAPDFVAALEAGVLARSGSQALVFGEDFSGDPKELAAYAKTDMNLLDFTLTFNSNTVFNANGMGNLGLVMGNAPSGDAGIGFQFGGMDPSVALGQVHNHDVNLPRSENLAYAFLLTRSGQPVVYFDGNNLPTGNFFPKSGRSDALGEGTDFTVRLVDAHNEYARGEMVSRLASVDVYVYERQVNGQSVLLVGLNDRSDTSGATSVTVQTAFPPGETLLDLSGQMPPLTVGPDQRVTLSVPNNFDSSQPHNGRGYVLYALQNPQGVGQFPITIEQNGVALSPQAFPTADGAVDDPAPGTVFLAPVVTSDTVTFRLLTDSAARAVVRLDGGGIALAGRVPITGSEEGLSDGFVPADGSGGVFSLADVDLSRLREGLQVVEFRAFLGQPPGRPPIFNSFRQVFIFDRPDAGTHILDGQLNDFSTVPLAVQTVATTEEGRNELNRLLREIDGRNLVLGLVANAEATESPSSLKGVVVWIDVACGDGVGLINFGLLDDDSGPAARLLSNAEATAPGRFAADFALASFRGAELSAIQTLVSLTGQRLIGGPRAAHAVGSAAGFYRINTSQLNNLEELPALIAWHPPTIARDGPAAESAPTGGAGDGMEAAISLDVLFPNFDGDGVPGNDNEDGGIPPGTLFAFHAYIVSTGETEAILAPADPERVTVGGRPRFLGQVSNQILTFLPTGCN